MGVGVYDDVIDVVFVGEFDDGVVGVGCFQYVEGQLFVFKFQGVVDWLCLVLQVDEFFYMQVVVFFVGQFVDVQLCCFYYVDVGQVCIGFGLYDVVYDFVQL